MWNLLAPYRVHIIASAHLVVAGVADGQSRHPTGAEYISGNSSDSHDLVLTKLSSGPVIAVAASHEIVACRAPSVDGCSYNTPPSDMTS
ncbi:unnamed protein product [Phytophthora fragariaefolia]|uniref:Unnamed protein product n=1 Tax=Phytophthora fragariaefolia TaxID=1490495 RepID=A0A9W6XU62_9STRA|nr:unnamed protein product [Phytophthora fragariaefolia]